MNSMSGDLEPFIIKPGEEVIKQLKSNNFSWKLVDSMEDGQALTWVVFQSERAVA
jgi:hypothetical protein